MMTSLEMPAQTTSVSCQRYRQSLHFCVCQTCICLSISSHGPMPTSMLSISAVCEMTADVSDMQARSKAGSDASKQGSYFGQNVDKLEDLPPLPKPSGQCCALSLFVDAACLLSLPEVFCSSVCVTSCSACSACCLDNCTCDLFLKLQVCVYLKHACLWVRSVWQPEGMVQSC